VEKSWLVRDYIDEHLYGGPDGYFASGTVIGPMGDANDAPLDFSALEDEDAFRDAVARRYRETSRWMTPVEVFAPFYSWTVCDALAASHHHRASNSDDADEPHMLVLEVGGGTGTNARHFLDRLRDAHTQIYGTVRYVILEVSPGLAERQRRLLAEAGHAGRFEVIVGSALDIGPHAAAILGTMPGQHHHRHYHHRRVYVVALEVLDNMPHDRVVQFPHGPLLETRVVLHRNGSMSETCAEATDPDLLEAHALVGPWTDADLEHVAAGDGLADG
jgi:SAM-dependent methyltransferase